MGLLVNLHSQNFIKKNTNLTLLDGKKIELESYFIDNENACVFYTFLKKGTKIKTGSKFFEDIYSINDSIIYNPGSAEEYTISEMASVINGSSYALKNYEPWWAIVTGAVVGTCSMFGTNNKYISNSYIGFSIPIAYMTGMYFVKPSKSYIIKHYPEYSNNDMFVQGFRDAGSRKIFRNTAISTLSGVICGMVLSEIIK